MISKKMTRISPVQRLHNPSLTLDNIHAGLIAAEALNKAQLWLRDVTKVELEQWIYEKQLRLSRKQRAKLEQLSIERA